MCQKPLSPKPGALSYPFTTPRQSPLRWIGAKDALSGYAQTQRTVSQYRLSLQAMADAHWADKGQKPIVVFIDELDRCRPSYAVELLETAKHIFSVNHVVYVLAVNRSELTHSVKALYGEGFGATAYLRRFFDVDFRLPPPDRHKFIEHLLTSASIPSFFEEIQDNLMRERYRQSVDALTEFFNDSAFTLRDVGQAVHRFGLVLSSLSKAELALIRTLTALLIIQQLDPSLYRRLADHDDTLTDEQAVEEVFRQLDRWDLRSTEAGQIVVSVIIGSMLTKADVTGPEDGISATVPLFRQLRSDRPEPPSIADLNSADLAHFDLFQLIKDYFAPDRGPLEPLNFDLSVRRLELISGELRGRARPIPYSLNVRR